MCTVTYLPLENDGFILTSNRDESPMRKTIPPKKYLENGVELAYPKDQLAGGTWIGASTKNRLVCLLNGAFKKHERNSYYKMSRGLVVKNILTVTVFTKTFAKSNPSAIVLAYQSATPKIVSSGFTTYGIDFLTGPSQAARVAAAVVNPTYFKKSLLGC